MKTGKRFNDKNVMLTIRLNANDANMIAAIAKEIGTTKSAVVRTAVHDNLSSYLHFQQQEKERSVTL